MSCSPLGLMRGAISRLAGRLQTPSRVPTAMPLAVRHRPWPDRNVKSQAAARPGGCPHSSPVRPGKWRAAPTAPAVPAARAGPGCARSAPQRAGAQWLVVATPSARWDQAETPGDEIRFPGPGQRITLTICIAATSEYAYCFSRKYKEYNYTNLRKWQPTPRPRISISYNCFPAAALPQPKKLGAGCGTQSERLRPLGREAAPYFLSHLR
jgi:hypothetical protein